MAEKVGRAGAVIAMMLVLVAAGAYRTAAQSKTAPPAAQNKAKAPTRTTLDGIYTATQALRGEEMYFGTCVNCHPPGTYAGASFKKNWNGRPLSDLYDWILNKMPKSAPGTLSPQESTQVMAYILRENKMPAGKVALPADPSVLSAIKIQIK